MIVKQFEIPTIRFAAYIAKDILTSSAEEPTTPTEKPRPGEFITPEDEF